MNTGFKTLVPCLLCKRELDNCDPEGNQPSDGTEFYTSGHYGSSVTDMMDGTGFAINICDSCLRGARQEKLVLIVTPPEPQPRQRPSYRVWR